MEARFVRKSFCGALSALLGRARCDLCYLLWGSGGSQETGVGGRERLAGGKAVKGFEGKPWISGKGTIIAEEWMLPSPCRDDHADCPGHNFRTRADGCGLKEKPGSG